MASGNKTISAQKTKQNNKAQAPEVRNYETQMIGNTVAPIKPEEHNGVILGNGQNK